MVSKEKNENVRRPQSFSSRLTIKDQMLEVNLEENQAAGLA